MKLAAATIASVIASASPVAASQAVAQATVDQPMQTAAGDQQVPDSPLPTPSDDIVVTGSRIVAPGFTAPTPTSVVSSADVMRVAPSNVADALVQLPNFRLTLQPSSAAVYANLRNIGAQRTLLLINGRRHVPTFSDGTADLNLIPTLLVERAEVVTGGASASYGSDAVAGVVNILLRNKLRGIEMTAQSGVSTYGDNGNYTIGLAAGTGFAGGRGNIVIGAEHAFNDGVRTNQPNEYARPWRYRGVVGNSAFAANGLPGTLYVDDARRADTSDGGLITAGPLRGTNFGPNGTTSAFGYGQVFGNNMIGGTSNDSDSPIPGGDLMYPFRRTTVMGHVDFDATDWLQLFAEGSFGRSISQGYTNPGRNNGSITAVNSCAQTTLASALGSINVNINNAFLPQAVRQRMLNAGISCFAMGRTFRDPGMGQFRVDDGSPSVYRAVAGFTAKLGSEWQVDGYLEYGRNEFRQRRIGNINVASFRKAIDTVLVNGAPACRVNTDAVAANDDPSCAPFNLFGNGSPSQAAIAYVTGTSELDSTNIQKVASLSVSGPLGSLWAGPIRIAAGAEYRYESVDTRVDAISQASGWQTANRKAIAGNYDVREVFGELVLPLLKDSAIGRSLELDLAGRYTDYSSSGGVTTWKAGVNYELTDSLRLRATRSRDIRAGNLGELFTATAVAVTNVQDPRSATITPVPVTTTGNRDLEPERADTITAGAVYQPQWLRGLRLSVDYYNIKIRGQIATITAQQVLNNCFQQNAQQFCDQVALTNNVISGVTVGFENLDRFETNGVDIEAAYRTRVGGNTLSARLLANYVAKLATTAASNAAVTDPSGQYDNPHWTLFGTFGFERGGFSATTELRYFGAGKIDNTKVGDQVSAVGVNRGNHVDGTLYTNLTLDQKIDDGRFSVFARVNNLFNANPPYPVLGTANAGIFDIVGRAYRVGARVKF